jgi:sugar/nucleoside kinase (ribokinase family)
VPRLPLTGEDMNIERVDQRLGGCAYNVARVLRKNDVPHQLCSPVGTGMYGGFVLKKFEEEAIPPFIRLDRENGCCYCLIEQNGERSFLSNRGAEYVFRKEWMETVDFSDVDSVFVCGLDIEDPTGGEIVDFICEKTSLTVFFAPGPRLTFLDKTCMERIFARSPFLHLNESEALRYSGRSDAAEAARFFFSKTGNSLVITLGDRGAYFWDAAAGAGGLIPAAPVRVKDTVGAGDAHCGAIIAAYKQGKPLREGVASANYTAATVVGGFFNF